MISNKNPHNLLMTIEQAGKLKLWCFDFVKRVGSGPSVVETDLVMKESDNSDSIFLQESSLLFVCINF
jgi:hypothetical protein